MIAEVRLWGRTIGAVSMDDGAGHAAFQFTADFSESVRLILTHVAGQVAPSEVGFEPVTPSHFQASLLVPVPGTYDVTVVARVSEFDEVSTTTTVVVAPGLR